MTNQELADKLNELLPNLNEAIKLVSNEYNIVHTELDNNKDCRYSFKDHKILWLDDLFHFIIMIDKSINYPPFEK